MRPRAPRWFVRFPCFPVFFTNTDLGFTRDRRPNGRKSGKPDLRGPLQPVAVTDQRCTLADARAASRPGHAIATAGFLIMDSLVKQPSSFPHPHCCVRALPFCFANPNEGWAERRETFGCLRDTRWTCRNAARQALARRLASHDAGRSPLGAPPWRFSAPGPRFSVTEHPPPLTLRPASGSLSASSSQPGHSA
jgi:hypothetical protein